MKVSELFASPKNYCKSHIAISRNGLTTYSNDAVGWCLIGAMQKTYGYVQGEWEVRLANLKKLVEKVLPTWDWSGRELDSPCPFPNKLNIYEKGNFQYILRNLSYEESFWLAKELDL